MGYTQIAPEDVFVYKALPHRMNDRVHELPPIAIAMPPVTGFVEVDKRARQEAIEAIDWRTVPEQRPTGNSFVDEFAAQVHRHGFKGAEFYAAILMKDSVDVATGKSGFRTEITAGKLNNALFVLTGLNVPQWVTAYTLLMIHDLERRTSLRKTEIADLLGFASPSVYSQFLRNHEKK